MSRKFKPDPKASVLVVGDIMLDRYIYGETRRISPEAPVPVVRVQETEERPGGAANVALNIAAYETGCCLIGLTGEDVYSDRLMSDLGAYRIDCQFIRQADMPTITKERVISQHQQLLRLDYELAGVQRVPEVLFEVFENRLEHTNAVVLSDYAKGCLGEVERLIKIAKERDLFVMIDPKGINFGKYSGASLLTPNQHEFEAIVGPCPDESTLVEKAANLCTELKFEALLITRGEHGMSLVQSGREAVHLSTEAREVFDVTGAGDTVIATMAAAIVAGYPLADAMFYANKAAGLSVAKLGAVSVSTRELNQALGPGRNHKVVSEAELNGVIERARTEKKCIVFTNGCFDIIHAGHVSYLKQAAELGDLLIVAVNSDDSVTGLKGPDRPVNSLEDRMQVLAAIESVDYVIAFNEETPERLIQVLEPDILVKGEDYQESEIAGAEFVIGRGGKVHRIALEEGRSTSAIINAMKTSGKSG
ncbi:MAG: bifunctional D-glycero-beta-D-manno-heptose-7-phosphate kinase/D-glycero-beta-D-manno-heptose 1-phosphate adenylyltransferase HldE [Gammaproteobacteria bacterium]|nr:bifunctional D-glycero-beta-D-manno-heptose-7-phosphate kinase/D-glycero-beta-D-manno-heptose 1-phosphate adenylyltransferase HldE [Gammaproteobacteria bacterium]